MLRYILTIFLSAFLLFQVQPILARYILPWYGGTPAVWTTCMLCFQIGLLAGYTYAHGLVAGFRGHPRKQAAIHFCLILASLVFLPITPTDTMKPEATADPTWGIVLLLLKTVGLPFIVISASGPLIQHWFFSASKSASPYRLYAVSNFGSLLGLLSYPFLFEPLFGLRQQTQLWSVTYIVYGICATLCAWGFIQNRPSTKAHSEGATSSPAPTFQNRISWGVFAALGSIVLLATTNQMCQDVAVVPFLWVLPLSLYLITFIISFDHARWYHRGIWIPLTTVSVAALVYLLNQDYADVELHISIQVGIYLSAMFSCCMVCHGEMVRLKPAPTYLTSFYLVVSLGGAIGGILVSQVAPRIFIGMWELHLSLLAVALMIGYRIFQDTRSGVIVNRFWLALFSLFWIQVVFTMSFFLWLHIEDQIDGAVASKRSFYGSLRVYDGNVGKSNHWRALYHGRINHGRQYLDYETFRAKPSTYYMQFSGAGLAFDFHPKRLTQPEQAINIGVVGLGTGTLASYANSSDSIRFYEINPDVETLAREYFSYLKECPADLSIKLGDARITLEAELAAGESNQFDLLFVDAFSGDSIPIHLFTEEAFDTYLKHLAPDGILVVHITNLHIDLSDPVRVLGDVFDLESIWVARHSKRRGEYYSNWVLMSRQPETLNKIKSQDLHTDWEREEARLIHWTDDYSNLLTVIKWD